MSPEKQNYMRRHKDQRMSSVFSHYSKMLSAQTMKKIQLYPPKFVSVLLIALLSCSSSTMNKLSFNLESSLMLYFYCKKNN